MYRDVVARLALRAIDEAFASTPPSLVDVVAFNGHVNAKDRATGTSVRPCLISVRATRDTFEGLVLDEPELDPRRACASSTPSSPSTPTTSNP